MRVAALLALSACLLTGCGLTSSSISSSTPASPAVVAMGGNVHGGNQPVSGATVQLWQVGTSGYGSAPSTVGSSVTTDANGNFSLAGAFTCPASNTLVFLTATGGNPGLAAGTSNNALVMLTAIGQCGAILSSSFFTINEVTTVAGVYALAQFMTPAGGLGSYASSTTGITNAFATINNLVATVKGTARSVTSSGLVQAAKINALANILTPCVNSTGATSSNCMALFSAATSPSGSAPANTLAAALDIALNPANNVTPLFNLSLPNPAFQPTLSSAPNDWTLALSYASGGTTPYSLALDSLGNVWIANYGGSSSGGANSSVSLISPLGVPASNSPFTSSNNLIYGARALAIDSANNVWIANYDNSTASELNASYNGSNYTINTVAGPYSNVGLSSPQSVAIDGNNGAWFTNVNDSVVELSPQVILEGGSGQIYTNSSLNDPQGIAFDSLGNAWIANNGSGAITVLNPDGIANTPPVYSGAGLAASAAVALDGSNHVWVTSATNSLVSEFTSTGAPVNSSGISAGGVTSSFSDQIDGAGNLWVADFASSRLTGLTPAGAALSPSTGFQGGNLSSPRSLAIDASGNIWLANSSPVAVNGQNQTVTEFIGLAAPVNTPLTSGQLGVRAGTPIPVTIQSVALPVYTPGQAYTAKLIASGGNSGAYTWSLASGTLPSGFTLSSAGILGGNTSATGNTAVTLQACDSAAASNCASQSFTLSSAGSMPLLGNESALKGSYAIRLGGLRNLANTSTPGTIAMTTYVGSFTFNGAGAITAGEIDISNPGGSSINSLTGIVGSYTLGANNLGYITIPQNGTHPIEFSISVGTFSSGVAQTIHLIEFDDTQAASGGTGGSLAAGIGKLQNAAAFTASTLDSTFVFGLQGETACTNFDDLNPSCPQVTSPYGPLSAAGYFTGSGSSLSGEEDASATNMGYPTLSLSGTFTAPDSFGRGTLTMTLGGPAYPAPPASFVYYIVNSGELFLMSASGHLNNSLLFGDALQQATGVFSSSNPNPLTNNVLFYGSLPSNADGVASNSVGDITVAYLITPTGSSVNVIGDNVNSGVVALDQQLGTFTYSVDAHGRLTLSNNVVVGYLANASGLGFANNVISTGTQSDPGLFNIAPQSPGPFSVASVNGTYAYATVNPPASASVSNGVFTSSGNGSITSLSNTADVSGVLSTGNTGTYTLTMSPFGRGVVTDSSGNTNIVYILNSSTVLFFPTTTTNISPLISIGQQ